MRSKKRQPGLEKLVSLKRGELFVSHSKCVDSDTTSRNDNLLFLADLTLMEKLGQNS